MVDKILDNCPTPFHYYRNYLEKLHCCKNYNVNKKKEGNSFFDFNIAYIIDDGLLNDKPLYFVTDDDGLAKAAKDTRNENKVIKLEKYLNSIGI
jgi:hypothetical protein